LRAECIRVLGALRDAEGGRVGSIYEQISGMDELLQMSVIEVIWLDCKNDSAHPVSGLEVDLRGALMALFCFFGGSRRGIFVVSLSDCMPHRSQ
jgi:hypothetical protein